MLERVRGIAAATERATGIVCDHASALNGFSSRQDYPEHLLLQSLALPHFEKPPLSRAFTTPAMAENRTVTTSQLRLCDLWPDTTDITGHAHAPADG